MPSYIIRRLLYFIPTLILISVISFAIIQAPPGDFVTTLAVQMEARGDQVDEDLINALRARYGLGKPLWRQYLIWMGNILQGDLGVSMAYNQPVSRIIMNRLPWSLLFFIFGVHYRLFHRLPHRLPLGGAPILDCRLRPYLRWVHRSCRSEFHARPHSLVGLL